MFSDITLELSSPDGAARSARALRSGLVPGWRWNPATYPNTCSKAPGTENSPSKNPDRNPPHFSRFRQKYLEPRKDDIIYNIPHHGFSQLTDEENLPKIPEEREDWLQRLEKRPYNIDISLGTIHLDSLFSTASDPDVSLLETWETWVASMQLHYTMFMLTSQPPGTELEILMNHKVRHFKAVGPMYCANASNWATAFFLTTICRSEEKRRELCEIPVDFIKKAGESDGAQYNPFTYHWISALRDCSGLWDQLIGSPAPQAPVLRR